MKNSIYIFIIFFFIGLQFLNAQESDLITTGATRVNAKKIKIKTKRTLNEAKRDTSADAMPVDGLDCLRDLTGECVDAQDNTEVGSTAGSLSVSLTGAANYSIPIMIPPGIKEVAPNIGLSYTSQGANGLAGWGWNLSGLSTISRIPATKYYDDVHDGVDFKDDRFSIDGQRLILKSGTYGANGSVYQTENYSNIKVIAYGTSLYGSTYGPSYFIVYYPNGTRAWYGNSGNSRSRLEWAIFRWQDPQGNYVDYNYQSDNGLLSIQTIKYGGRYGGTSPINQINFTYISRTRPENVYVGEHSFKRTNLLRSIQVTASGSQYRKYELTHNTTSLGYQRVTSVKEYNAENKALRPITFDYDHTSSWVKDRVVSGDLYPGFDFKEDALISGDYDGDGRTDVIFYDTTNKNDIYLHYDLYNPSYSLAYKISTGGFSDIFPSTILTHNNKLLRQQAITTVKETGSYNSSSSSVRFRTFAKAPSGVYLQYDRTWSAPRYRSDNYCGNSRYNTIPKKYISGDFNGDGLTDVLAIEKQYTTRWCVLVECDDDDDNGPKIEQLKGSLDKKDTKTLNDDAAPIIPIELDCCECYSFTRNQNTANVYFIDLKRDVTSDFSNLSGYFRSSVGTTDKVSVGDHNGDGKQDIYHFKEGKLYIYTLNASNSLVLLHEETDSGIKLRDGTHQIPLLMGDYNGDGKTDFIVATANKSTSWKYFMSKGTNYNKQTKSLPFAYYQDELIRGSVTKNGVYIYNPYYEYRYTAQDVNGDGKTDLMLHNVIAPYSAYDRSVEYISIYKNNQSNYSSTPYFSYEMGYTDTSGDVGKFGSPIFLESNVTNSNLEYGYVSVNNIFMYEFVKDHRKDATLKSVTNNGVKTNIDYGLLGPEEERYGQGYGTYYPDSSQNYPFININKANSFQLVKKLTEEGAGITRYQDFIYHGAVSNINIGFQGFLKTKRSNWHGDGVGTLWTISKHDVTKKGAVAEQWISTSTYEGSNYISKTTNTYETHVADNKVFTNIPTKVVSYNALEGTTTTQDIEYDSYKNPTKTTTTFSGGRKIANYTYRHNVGTNSHYYHVGRMTKKTETSTIGSNSFTTEQEYAYSNNLLTQQKVRAAGTSQNIETFQYDAFGNVTQRTLSASGITSRTEKFTYDSSGRFLTESTDIEDLTTQFTYDTFGNPKTTTNPYGQITRFDYDGWNRLIKETNYLSKITSFSYERSGSWGLKKTTNYPVGADEIVYYNALGWATTKKVLGLDNKWTNQVSQYDVAGRKVRESEPFFYSPSQWNTISYDNYGRMITQTSFTGKVANITYSGLSVTVDDEVKTVKTTKDGAGNVIKAEDSGGTVNYQYYGNGVIKTANYGSHIVSTEIDAWGRKKKLTDPSAGTYTYEYNNIGEIKKETTPKGNTVYEYDAFGKITKKEINGDATDMVVNYSYNNTTKLLESTSGANNITNEDYSYTYSYDSYKRLYKTKETNEKATFEHQIQRDTYGRVFAETYFSRNEGNGINNTVKVKNVYQSSNGVLAEIRDYNTNALLWKIKEVNERGQAKAVELGNGMTKKRTYNNYGFLTNITDQKTGDGAATALNVNYTFDVERGNLSYRKNVGLNFTENFTYDSLDRLTRITGNTHHTQTYDDSGRITENSSVGDYAYDSSNRYRLKEVALNTQGDLYYQQHSPQEINYNAYKKPISIYEKDQGRVNFEHNILMSRSHAYYGGLQEEATDRRYEKHYSSISPVEIEIDKQGGTKIITYIGGDAYTAPVVHIKQEGGTAINEYHYLHRDYLGSILAISNSSGTVLEQRHFGAWGQIEAFKKGTGLTDFNHTTTLLNRGYTGHEHFFEVSLIHMNGRMYDAKLGRFLSPDNYIQDPFNTQSFNRYGYVWNNPLKFTDPSGESFWETFASILVSAVFTAVGVIVGVATAGAFAFAGYVNFNTGDWQVYAGGYTTIGSTPAAGLINFGVKDGKFSFFAGFSFSPQTSKEEEPIDEIGGDITKKGDFLLNEKISKGHKPTDTGEIARSTGLNANDKYGEYGWTRNGGSKLHKGVDYVSNDGGNAYAMYDGKVNYAGSAQGYGKMVQIKSSINERMYNVDYGHLKSFSVKTGQNIKAGDLLGQIGRVGNILSMSAKHYPTHVHISIWRYVNGNRGFVKPWW